MKKPDANLEHIWTQLQSQFLVQFNLKDKKLSFKLKIRALKFKLGDNPYKYYYEKLKLLKGMQSNMADAGLRRVEWVYLFSHKFCNGFGDLPFPCVFFSPLTWSRSQFGYFKKIISKSNHFGNRHPIASEQHWNRMQIVVVILHKIVVIKNFEKKWGEVREEIERKSPCSCMEKFPEISAKTRHQMSDPLRLHGAYCQ